MKEQNLTHNIIKILLVGDEAAGKTTLRHTINGSAQPQHYSHTLAIEQQYCYVTHLEKVYKLQIFDSPGAPRYYNYLTDVYRTVDIIFYVVNLAKKTQISHIQKRLLDICGHISKPVPIILIGNLPMNNNSQVVSSNELREIAHLVGLTYIEVNIFTYQPIQLLISASLDMHLSGVNADPALNTSINSIALTNNLQASIDDFFASTSFLNKSLVELFQIISKLNIIIDYSMLIKQDLSRCYKAKLELLNEAVSRPDLFKNLKSTAKIYVEFIDAIGSALLISDFKFDINSQHSILQKLNRFISENLACQKITLIEYEEAHSSRCLRYFPNDDVFQPLITSKLVAWSRDQSVGAQLKILRNIPYLSSTKVLADQIIDELIGILHRQSQVNTEAYELLAEEFSGIIRDYLCTQTLLLANSIDELCALQLCELRVLQHCLPSLFASKLWINLRYLEDSISKINQQAAIRFIMELLNPDETIFNKWEVIRLSALAGFLINNLSLEKVIDINFNLSKFTHEELGDRSAILQFFIKHSFASRALELSKSLDNSSTCTQLELDLLNRFEQLDEHGLTISEFELKQLSTAILHLLESLSSLSDNPDEVEGLMIVLVKITFEHLGILTLIDIFQKLVVKQEKVYISACQHLLSKLLNDIDSNETYEHYLERLSAAVSLHAIYEPMQPHYLARMILLINAFNVIEVSSDEQRLLPNDFKVEYGDLGCSPVSAFEAFVKDRQKSYLRALCSCYRLNTKLAVKIPTLIKQYLTVKQQNLPIAHADNNLIGEILNNQISIADTVAIVEELSLDNLIIFATHHFTILSNLIRSITPEIPNNTFENCCSAYSVTLKISDNALELIGRAIMIANKQVMLYADIISNKLNIYNHNIFIILAMIFENSPKDRDNSDQISELLVIILNAFFDEPSNLYVRIKNSNYITSLSRLLACAPIDTPAYNNIYLPNLNKIAYNHIVNMIAKAFNYSKNPINQSEYMSVLFCILINGADITDPQKIITPQSSTTTNAILTLIKNKNFDILKQLLEFYRNNPQAIIDSNKITNYCGENPLYLAICNGGDTEIITQMLELGFSTELVNNYLLEKHDTTIIKQAVPLKKNSDALTALYLFITKCDSYTTPHSNTDETVEAFDGSVAAKICNY